MPLKTVKIAEIDFVVPVPINRRQIISHILDTGDNKWLIEKVGLDFSITNLQSGDQVWTSIHNVICWRTA